MSPRTWRNRELKDHKRFRNAENMKESVAAKKKRKEDVAAQQRALERMAEGGYDAGAH